MKLYSLKDCISAPFAIITKTFENINEDAIFISQPCLLKENFIQRVIKIVETNPYINFISFTIESSEENLIELSRENTLYYSCYFKRYGPTDNKKYGLSLAYDLTHLYLTSKIPEMPNILNRRLIYDNLETFISKSLDKTKRYKEIIDILETIGSDKEKFYLKFAYYFSSGCFYEGLEFLKFCDLDKLLKENFYNLYIIFDSFCISSYYKDKSMLPKVLPYLLNVPIRSKTIRDNIKYYTCVLNIPYISNYDIYLLDLLSSTHHLEITSSILNFNRLKFNNVDEIGIHLPFNLYIPSKEYYHNCFNLFKGEYIIWSDNIERAKDFFKSFNLKFSYTNDYHKFLSCSKFIISSSILPCITRKEIIAPSTQNMFIPSTYIEDPYYISVVSEDSKNFVKQTWKYYEVVESIDRCKYDIIAFHYKGDIWESSKLEKQLKVYSQGNYDVVGCFIDKEGIEKPKSQDFLKPNTVYKGSIMTRKEITKCDIHDLNIKGYSFYNIPEILLNTERKDEVKDEIKEKYKNSVTIVTGFYRVNTGKYPKHYYNEWITNFLTLDCNTVAFISKEDKLTIELIEKSGKKNIKVIFKELEEFHNKKYYESYKWQNTIDIEKHLHYPEMYMIWNEKPFMVLEATKVNPFNSEWFAWVDFGSCRSPEHAKQVKGFGNVFKFIDEKVDHNKICFITIQPLSEKEKEMGENNIPKCLANLSDNLSCKEIARFQGGFFKGRKDLWPRFCELYDQEIEHFIKHNTFCGKEQNIMISLMIKYPKIMTSRLFSRNYYNPYFAFYNDYT